MNGTRVRRRGIVFLALLALSLGTAHAQWVSQTIALRPGWNTAYIEVRPEPAEFDTVFAGLPIEGVWVWNKRFSPREFELDPNVPLARNPHWMLWLPPENPAAFLSGAFRLQACQSYLIKVRTNASPFNLVLKGKATVPHVEWFPHALNLLGFPVNPAAPPTFQEFFQGTPRVDTTRGLQNELYAVEATGRGRTIVQPYRDRIQPGVAYWVKCDGALDYEGPLRVTTAGAGALDFGDVVQENGLSVANLSTGRPYTVTIAPMTSETPPPGQAELAGPVPLSYLVSSDGSGAALVWSNLPAAGLTKTLAPGETWSLQFGVRRNDMAAYAPSGTNGACYQSILRVTDAGQSLRIHVPVVADKEGVRRLAAGEEEYLLATHHRDEGLWVGQAVINQVSCPSYSTNDLLPTESDLGFRILLHVNSTGVVRMLQRVYLAWVGSETNGEYKLYLNETNVPASSPEVKRISAVTFPLMGPVTVTNQGGAVGAGLTNKLGAKLTLRFDDPTNPFLHRYHPMLDNKDGQFHPYTNAVEAKTVTREITLDFSANAYTNGVADPFYGLHEIGGVYDETLGGLRYEVIRVRGSVYLKRVSLVNVLN